MSIAQREKSLPPRTRRNSAEFAEEAHIFLSFLRERAGNSATQFAEVYNSPHLKNIQQFWLFQTFRGIENEKKLSVLL